MNEWSTNFQNPDFMKKSRMMIINRELAAYTVEKLGLKSGMCVLDVGCGTGEFTYYLAKACSGIRFYGIDNDDVFISVAQKSEKRFCTNNEFVFQSADALKLPFEDHIFDVVVSHTFLTSVFDYCGAIAQMQRVCKIGGVIASVTADNFDHIPVCEGFYPPQYDWLTEYNTLNQKVMNFYEAVKPAASYANGIDPKLPPYIFSRMGLKSVRVYPLGKFFSLSNGAMSNEDKKTYIHLDYSAEMQKFETFCNFPDRPDFISEDEAKRYRELLLIRRDALLEDVGENSVWEWTGGENLLVIGENKGVCAGKTPQSEYERSKFKACPPQQTAAHIKEILRSVGFEPEEYLIRSGVGELCSLRVSLKGTNIGQNGKGASPAYALASGYAELMERLQTGYLFQHDFSDQISCWGGFQAGCDEIRETPKRLAELGGMLLEESVRAIICASGGVGFIKPDTARYLEQWNFASKDGKMSALPFTRMKDGKIEYLPDCIYRAFYFTNGSCAGNNRSEALVQGMSEIAERWAAGKIMSKRLTPPVIPEGALDAVPELKETVRAFRSNSGLSLRIMDASCGVGLPVIAAAVIDKRRGAVSLKFGSHPRFETALERTLTEILQGKHISGMKYSPKYDLGKDEYALEIVNRFNYLKDASGIYPMNLFGSVPSWEYHPFDQVSETADGQLDYMLELYKKMGWQPYVRDCSFLGFPTYHIVVPGESMLLNFGAQRLTEKKLAASARPVLRNMAAATQKEREQAMRYVRLKQGWSMENSYASLAGIPYSPRLMGFMLDAGLINAIYDIHTGNYQEAVKILRPYSFNAAGEATGFHVLRQLVETIWKGKDMNQAAHVLRTLFSEEWVDEALKIIAKPLLALPQLDCFQCKGCPAAGRCKMDAAAPVMKNIREAMVKGRSKR